jgi:hypothetical protein
LRRILRCALRRTQSGYDPIDRISRRTKGKAEEGSLRVSSLRIVKIG